jgi:hypothetical protein
MTVCKCKLEERKAGRCWDECGEGQDGAIAGGRD